MNQKEPIDEKLEDLGKAIGSDEKLVENVMSRIVKEPTINFLQKKPQMIWSKVMKNPVRKLTAAAAIIIAALLINFEFSNSGVAWGALVEKVENAQNVVFRITTNTKVKGEEQEIPIQTEVIAYHSSEYGKLTEGYHDGKLDLVTCVNLKEPSVIFLFHRSKQFRKIIYDTPGKIVLDENDDPCVWVRNIMKKEYIKLGKNIINGKKVEGIEYSDVEAEVFGSSFKKVTARLWVEIGTNYPVRIEINGTIDMSEQFEMPDNSDVNLNNILSNMEMSMVMDDFQWNIELDPNIFYPDIPADYTNMDANINANYSEQISPNSTTNDSDYVETFQNIEQSEEHKISINTP